GRPARVPRGDLGLGEGLQQIVDEVLTVFDARRAVFAIGHVADGGAIGLRGHAVVSFLNPLIAQARAIPARRTRSGDKLPKRNILTASGVSRFSTRQAQMDAHATFTHHMIEARSQSLNKPRSRFQFMPSPHSNSRRGRYSGIRWLPPRFPPRSGGCSGI